MFVEKKYKDRFATLSLREEFLDGLSEALEKRKFSGQKTTNMKKR